MSFAGDSGAPQQHVKIPYTAQPQQHVKIPYAQQHVKIPYAVKPTDLYKIPVKSGFGPSTWYLAHNVDYANVTVRQWLFILWNYLSAFGLMYYAMTFLQEAECSWVEQPEVFKGYKGLWAGFLAIFVYFVLPHRMVHFHSELPYSQYIETLKEMQLHAKASYTMGTLSEAFCGTHAAQNPLPTKQPRLPGPIRTKTGFLPKFFEVYNMPMDYMTYGQWVGLYFNYLSAFALLFFFFTWLQEAEFMDGISDLKGLKGGYAAGCGVALYWLIPHRMYHFHCDEPGANAVYPDAGPASESAALGGGQSAEMVAIEEDEKMEVAA